MRNIAKDIATAKSKAQKLRQTVSTTSSMSDDLLHSHGQDYLDGEIRDNMIMTPYGVSSTTMAGLPMQTIVNDNDNTVSVGVFDPNRPKVGGGEVCLYSAAGTHVYLKIDGSIDILTPLGHKIQLKQDTSLNIETPTAGSMYFSSGGDIVVKNKQNAELNLASSGEATVKTSSQSIRMDTGGDMTFSDGKGNTLTLDQIKKKLDTI